MRFKCINATYFNLFSCTHAARRLLRISIYCELDVGCPIHSEIPTKGTHSFDFVHFKNFISYTLFMVVGFCSLHFCSFFAEIMLIWNYINGKYLYTELCESERKEKIMLKFLEQLKW